MEAIQSPDEYAELRNSLEFWEPHARTALDSAGLDQPERFTVPGESTNPVLVGDNGFVVKFYGEHWCGPDSLATETEAYQVLAGSGLPVPEPVANGSLFPGGEHWHWPFLVCTAVPGRPWPEAAGKADRTTELALAAQAGTLLRRLSALPLNGNSLLRPESPVFAELLAERRAVTVAEHREWGYLAPELLDSLAEQLPEVRELLGAPAFVHGDLHGRNLFVDTERAELTGLVDFNDVYAGNPYYGLVQLHLNTFRADRELLGTALDAAGWARGTDFARTMLGFTLLHDFDVFEEVPLDLTGITDYPELAEVLWGPE
ncbi:phosphotransferase family protein [Sciscionella sediminilitoris]|uniref:phosphotransferase family protein n=1 Tax=Sciscionella sediminilitoris TaxID=1445613 RepID=UPI0004DFCCCC|nr:aminoglycoside phosphotransferase family protein [Sciscionella sp. SE31]